MTSIRIPANLGPYRAFNEHTGAQFSFRPNGPITIVGDTPDQMLPNPRSGVSDKAVHSARLFVGLSVGEKPRWSYDDLIDRVTNFLEDRKRPIDASFIAQKGTYMSHVRKGETVVEDSAQVLIMNFGGWSSKKAFEKDMEQLADYLIVAMEQEHIYVDIQKDGVTQKQIIMASQEVLDAEKREKKRKRKKS